jgi:hypothetical protein
MLGRIMIGEFHEVKWSMDYRRHGQRFGICRAGQLKLVLCWEAITHFPKS